MTKNVICIKWGTKFGPEYVNRLYKMVQKNLSLPHRFVCFTDSAEGLAEGEVSETRECLCGRDAPTGSAGQRRGAFREDKQGAVALERDVSPGTGEEDLLGHREREARKAGG